jgi:hypothetical protein
MRKIHTIWYEMVYKRYEIGAASPGGPGCSRVGGGVAGHRGVCPLCGA